MSVPLFALCFTFLLYFLAPFPKDTVWKHQVLAFRCYQMQKRSTGNYSSCSLMSCILRWFGMKFKTGVSTALMKQEYAWRGTCATPATLLLSTYSSCCCCWHYFTSCPRPADLFGLWPLLLLCGLLAAAQWPIISTQTTAIKGGQLSEGELII